VNCAGDPHLKRLFDLFEIDVFPHGIGRMGRIGFFGLAAIGGCSLGSAARRISRSLVWAGLRLIPVHIFVHISELLSHLPGRFENRQEKAEYEFKQQVEDDPEEKYF
jgi:hypothetical protein